MSKISDMYEQIKQQQYLLVKTKLEEAIKAITDGRELSKQEQQDYQFSDNEIGILTDLLKNNEKSFYINSVSDYEMPTYSIFVMKVNDRYITTLTNNWGGKSVPSILSLESLKEKLSHFLLDDQFIIDEDEIAEGEEGEIENLDEELRKITVLPNIDLDAISITPTNLRDNQIAQDDKIEEETKKIDQTDKSYKDYIVNLKTYQVIEGEKGKNSVDYVNTADLQTVIYNLLRGVMIDTRANAKFNEGDNYCMIGEYSDMPGEEIIASLLNQLDRKVLQTYFKSNPADIYLFHEMSNKYKEIKPLDKEFEEKIKSEFRKKFEESLLGDNLVESDFFEYNNDELEAAFGEEVTRMEGFEQNNLHHMYDLWEHTLHTVESVDTEGLSPENAKILKVAAFFHVIGKPDVSSFNEKTGQQVFYGHAHKSVDVAKSILERLGYSQQETQRIGFFYRPS